MDKTSEAWKGHLVMVGEEAFHSAHEKALKELAPDGNFSQKEWNEANSMAMLEAVAAMIVENDIAHQ